MTRVQMLPEDYSRIVTAGASCGTWIYTYRNTICEAARGFHFEFLWGAAAQTLSCYSYAMHLRDTRSGKLAPLWRALVEVGFIIFLFYSNLLMGEFTQTNGRGKNLAFAMKDIFTINNFVIALISGLIGYVVVEFLRKRI